ncbi:MAG: methyltransferase domain-containing protein [Candidatus Pacebacteria bacterium]|nr:methyltransferase domain-containing protein [Candidatus Paceibacterota bacterium]
MENSSVRKKIASKNPWYTDQQIPNIENPIQTRTIHRRWSFFNWGLECLFKMDNNNSIKILDAGCGDGINQVFLTTLKNATIYACDYNPLRIERAKKAFPKTTFYEHDLTKAIDWGLTFDFILCSQVLEHIKQDELVLKNIRKVLNPNGILILGVPNEGCLFGQLRNKVFEPSISKTTDHINFYTMALCRQKIKSAGFSIIKVFYENFFFPTQRILSLFTSNVLGFNFVNVLNRIIPSQTGGFYFILQSASDQQMPVEQL